MIFKTETMCSILSSTIRHAAAFHNSVQYLKQGGSQNLTLRDLLPVRTKISHLLLNFKFVSIEELCVTGLKLHT